jgi:hypothetical protein
MAEKKKTEFEKELESLSDDDLGTMSEGAPSNTFIKAEVKRRKEKSKGGLDYKKSPKEE